MLYGHFAMVVWYPQPLMEAGVDSLGAVELRNALGTRFGIELPATVTLDFPSVSALSAHLAAVVAPSDDVIRGDDVASCTSSVSYSRELQVCAWLHTACKACPDAQSIAHVPPESYTPISW